MDLKTLTELLDVSVLDRLDRIEDLPADELAALGTAQGSAIPPRLRLACSPRHSCVRTP